MGLSPGFSRPMEIIFSPCDCTGMMCLSGVASGCCVAPSIIGPNVPIMLGATQQPEATPDKHIIPVQSQGLKMISMGLLNPGDKPMIWRGPMLHSVITQFLRSVEWGELDYLIIDLPPGTGDVQLTLIQTVAVTGAVLVTTPSTVPLADPRQAREMFRQAHGEVLGVCKNMITFA